MLSMISSVSLEPEPIPLDVKVVLFGERLLYYLLCNNGERRDLCSPLTSRVGRVVC